VPDPAASHELYGVKYLTSARLLRLELRDAALRRHVLLQVLILLQYIAQQRADADAYAAALAAVAAASAAPAAGAAGATAAGGGEGGAGERQQRGAAVGRHSAAAAATAAASAAAANAPAVAVAQAALAALRKPREAFAPGGLPSMRGDVTFLTNLSFHLLRRTGSDGLSFARGVAVLLQREHVWRAWKAASAPAFERPLPPLPAAAAPPLAADGEEAPAVGGKRRAGAAALGGGAGGGGFKRRRIALPKRPLGWASLGLDVGVWHVCADTSRVPLHAAEDYAAPMRTALDPDSGIEPEYWPSTNRAFVWRAYRAMAGERLAGMADAAALPFVDLVCKLFGIQRAVAAPAAAPAAASATATGGAAEGAAAAAGSAEGAEGGVSPGDATQQAAEAAEAAAIAAAADAPAAPGEEGGEEAAPIAPSEGMDADTAAATATAFMPHVVSAADGVGAPDEEAPGGPQMQVDEAADAADAATSDAPGVTSDVHAAAGDALGALPEGEAGAEAKAEAEAEAEAPPPEIEGDAADPAALEAETSLLAAAGGEGGGEADAEGQAAADAGVGAPDGGDGVSAADDAAAAL
jgi:hypothetical protein